MPASGPDPGYNNLIASHFKDIFKNRASYDAFAISTFRWVHSFKGWAWMTCVRFEDNGHPRTYSVFIKDGKIIDSRYAVQTDACNAQTYAAFDAMGLTRAGALVALRLPAMYQWPEMAEEGGFAAYGPRLSESSVVAARLAAKLLRGTKPGDIPIEQPTKFDLVINLKTAKAMGVTVPEALLARADKVIE